MKNLNRIFLIVLSVLVVQGFGGTAFAQCSVYADPNITTPPLTPAEQALSFPLLYPDDLECFWKAGGVDPDSASWLKIESYSWDNGIADEDLLGFSVTENNGFQRTGKIFVDVETEAVFTVVQDGKCSFNWEGAPSSTDEAYVAFPGCNSIFKVGQNGDEQSSGIVDFDVTRAYEGLVYGPESMPNADVPVEVLYAFDPTNGVIDRITIAETGVSKTTIYTSTDFQPRFAGFNQYGDLLVTDKGYPRVYLFRNLKPVGEGIQYIPAGGTYALPYLVWAEEVDGVLVEGSYAGVDFDVDGNLHVVDEFNGSVLEFEFYPECRDDSTCAMYETPPLAPISGLSSIVDNTGTANADVFVSAGSTIQRFDEDDNFNQSTCGDTFGTDTVIGVTSSANDTIHVTTVSDDGGFASVYEVPFGYNPCPGEFEFFCGGARLLATFGGPIPGNDDPPIVVGIALPFTNKSTYTGTPVCPTPPPEYEGPPLYAGSPIQGLKPGDLVDILGETYGQGFNSFDVYVEFIPSPTDAAACRVEVTSFEISPVKIGSVIANDAVNDLQPSKPLVLPGDDGRMRVFDFAEESGADCPPGDVGGNPLYTRNFSAFFTRVNPKIALCHDPVTFLTQCNVQSMSILDLEFGDIPGDGKLGGFDPRFSESFLIDQVPVGEYDGKWCGVDPPVLNEGPWLTANAGSVVPLDIKPVDKDDECGAKTIPDLVAVLDIWYASDAGYDEKPPFDSAGARRLNADEVNFSAGGSDSDYRYQFAAPNNPKRPYSLNWDTTKDDGQPLATGWYKLNIFDDSASSTGGMVYFPPQVVYVYLD